MHLLFGYNYSSLIPFNYILRKCTECASLLNQKKGLIILCLKKIKKKGKFHETIRIYCPDIVMEQGIENVPYLWNAEQKTNNGKNRTTKPEQNQNAWRKRKWQELENNQTSWDGGKIRKEYLRSMYWCINSWSSAPIVPLRYPFCSSGNNLRHSSEKYISSLFCSVRQRMIIKCCYDIEWLLKGLWKGPTNLESLKIYKIFGKVKKLFLETMENRKEED